MFFFSCISLLLLGLLFCNAVSTGCYENQEGFIGMFTSKDYPRNYENNALCKWRLTSPNSTVIQLRFTDFELEKSSDCLYDFLEIYDGNSKSSSFVGRYCGNEIPDVIYSSSNSLFLYFHTDGYDVRRGFEATWIAVSQSTLGEKNYISKRQVESEIEKCGGILHANEGTIQSPNFPNNYPASSHCIWILESNSSHQIFLKFIDFDLEKHIECRYDYVVVKDGRTRNAKVIAQYCGSKIPQEITTNGSALYVEFVSDTSTQNKGFKATWKMVTRPMTTTSRCGGLLNGETGVLVTPNYPDGFQGKELCTWVITVPESGQVELMFDDFQISAEQSGCGKVYVQLHDGTGFSGKKLGLFCGSSLPKFVQSKTNSMTVVFSPDGFKANRGFKARWITIYPKIKILPSDKDTPCGKLSNPSGYITTMSSKNCSWSIVVPEEMFVQIFIIKIDMFDDPDCRREWLEIRETAGAPLVFQTCGQLKSKPIMIMSNTAFIQHMVFNVSRLSFLKLFWHAINSSSNLYSPKYDDCISLTLESVDSESHGKVSPGRFPWVSAIIGMYGRIHCAGAILSPEWILTAAHCFQRLPLRSMWRVRAGEYDIMKDEGYEQDRAIKKIFIHSSYGSITHDNDIALLQLEEPLYFNNRVNKVCLPSEEAELPIGKKCSVAGWGARKYLRQPEALLAHVEPKIVSPNECNSSKIYNKRLTNRMFCAGDDGMDSCQGDGGSPLICIDRNRYYAIGLASWGNGCAFPGKFGVYTDVRKFRKWIENIIESN